ncbi:TPA: hypothetical protein N0F65_000546 [Lagenidium giganteum]|uniref:Exocyst complex component Sec8 n=1 Tax=Lagenidium giganteum TaxID=4803 RepID=A0AAV2Z232_9STRA|nr:TPA: hypothetical protein N0F65_000546 [Lagenidium giganteum]
MEGIDPVFFDKKFSVPRYMLRYIVGASNDDIRKDQLSRISRYRAIADKEIAGVIDENYSNFNTSLARFTVISNQLEDTRSTLEEVHQRSTDGKNILSSKTKNLRELLLQKYEAKKVIDIINDIQYIEAAPSKIHSMMSEKNFLGAVEMFSRSLDLVFSDKLVAFHAMTGVRNSLMECKQVIEDQLVQELNRIIFMKDAFTAFTKANQYSLASIENELSKDSLLDNEFDKHMFQSNQRDNDSTSFADPTTIHRANMSSLNPLEAAVAAVKLLHREVEVIGTLKTSMENELNEVVIQISLICRGIFNSSSYTSFDNKFTEKKFGKHDHSANFQTFLRLLFHVLRRIAQRHYLISIYFNSKGEGWKYGMHEIVSKIYGLLERVLSEYLEEKTPAEAQSAAKDTARTTDISGGLFKLSLNKPPRDANDNIKLSLPRDYFGRVIEETHTQVCEPSVFHLPVVYEDLEHISKDLQQFFFTSASFSGNNSVSSPFHSFINQFITKKWIPKVKTKAQQFLTVKYRNLTRLYHLPVPSDTSYQPPNMESLLYIAEELCAMMHKMPDHIMDLVSVLDATVLKWLDECAGIAKDISEPTLNHKHIIQSVLFSDLVSSFHDYEGYRKAKKAVPIPYQQSKVAPRSEITASPSLAPAQTKKGATSAPPPVAPVATTIIPVSAEKKSPVDAIRQLEYDIELSFYDPDNWRQGTKGLLMDNSRIAMMAYINSACDFISRFLQTIGSSGNDLGDGERSKHRSFGSGRMGRIPIALQETSWRCSALADECLFFVRREIRLHCFYFLTQIISQRFDMTEEQATMAQDNVLSLNINISSIENALQPYLSSDKMALVFDGIDHLLASILINNLQQMQGATFTKGGVQQMLLNVGALHQGLTGILYSYPSIGRTGYQFEHAKRYYQLLQLSETQLEVFVIENRKAYTADAYRALWRVETPHRVLSKGSVNKLDSLLR